MTTNGHFASSVYGRIPASPHVHSATGVRPGDKPDSVMHVHAARRLRLLRQHR